MMIEHWNKLDEWLRAASGSDAALDQALSEAFGVKPAPFTSSVEACRDLVRQTLPEWRLHLGYGASGIFPYAALVTDGSRVASDAPTVPLAVLRSAVAAKALQAPSAPPPA